MMEEKEESNKYYFSARSCRFQAILKPSYYCFFRLAKWGGITLITIEQLLSIIYPQAVLKAIPLQPSNPITLADLFNSIGEGTSYYFLYWHTVSIAKVCVITWTVHVSYTFRNIPKSWNLKTDWFTNIVPCGC